MTNRSRIRGYYILKNYESHKILLKVNVFDFSLKIIQTILLSLGSWQFARG